MVEHGSEREKDSGQELHPSLFSFGEEPGRATHVPWPIRGGKTTTVCKWVAENPDKKVIFLVPSWGDLSDPESGVGAKILDKLRTHTAARISVAGGRGRSCPEWDGAHRQKRWHHSRAYNEHCKPCTHHKTWADLEDADDTPPGASPPFPQEDVYEAGWCPNLVGRHRLINLNRGEIVVTTPSTFRQAVGKLSSLSDDEESTFEMDAWADDLVVVWDESHRDDLFLVRESLDEPFTLDVPGDAQPTRPESLSDYEDLEPPSPDFLQTLPDEVFDHGQEQGKPWAKEDMEGGEEVARQSDPQVFCDWFSDELEKLLDVAWQTYLEQERLFQSQSFFERVNDRATGGVEAGTLAEYMEDRMEDTDFPVRWIPDHLEDEVIPSLRDRREEQIDREGRRDRIGSPETIGPAFADSTEIDAIPANYGYIPEAPHAEPKNRELWTGLREWTKAIEEIWEALVHKTDLSDSARKWRRLMAVLKDAKYRDNLLWVEYLRKSPGADQTELNVMALDAELVDEDGKEIVQPRYTPLQEVLDAGGSVALLSATPGHGADTGSFLGDHEIETVEYPSRRPKPKMRLIAEMKVGSIQRELTKENGILRLTPERKQLVQAILDKVNEPVHIVARNKDEYHALQDAFPDVDEARLHYFRDASSLGVQWGSGAEEDVDGVILAMGPPNLPPTLLASLRGFTKRDKHWTLSASQAWQTERMAMEALQTLGRGIRISWPGQEEQVGRVILLGAKHRIQNLDDYAERFGIETDVEQVPATRDMEERAIQIVRELEGKPYLPPKARIIYEKYRPDRIYQGQVRNELGMNGETFRDARDVLIEEGHLVEGEKEGRKQWYEWTDKVHPS